VIKVFWIRIERGRGVGIPYCVIIMSKTAQINHNHNNKIAGSQSGTTGNPTY
jgi:hypothetical protein